MTFCYRIAYLMLLALLSNIKLFYAVACREDNRISNLEDPFPQTECSNDVNSQCYRNYDTDLENLFNFAVVSRRSKNNVRTLISKNKRISLTPFPCPCEVVFGPMDLGLTAYPRFVLSGICKDNTCGDYHRCQPKIYNIMLLKRREPGTERSKEFRGLQEPLTEDWVPNNVKIVVDCDCVPFKK